MARAFDTHAHLQDSAFDGESREVAARAVAAGLAGMLLCGYDEAANLAAIAMAAEYEGVYAAVGFHPHDAKDVTPAMLQIGRAHV